MTDKSPAEPSTEWWLTTHTIFEDDSASVALEAILASEERLRGLGRREMRFAFRAITEGTWWVAALDEQLRSRLTTRLPSLSAAYSSDRNADENGQYVPAFLWARNRHAHQLPFTTMHDDELAVRQGGVPSKFSEELKWMASADYPPVEKRFEDAGRRDVYDRLLAGQPINATLYQCALWFNKAAGRDPEWEQGQQSRCEGANRAG